MYIDRERVKQVFHSYTNRYDASDGKIKLKIDHTYRVAAICERIAKSLFLSEADIDLAWLLGILHDIGRFEQLKRYGTFSDAQSIDHAKFGVDLLYGESPFAEILEIPGKEEKKDEEAKQYGVENSIFLEDFISIDKKDDAFELIAAAIGNHSAFRIEKGLDQRTEMYCHILRDADKVDIFKVCQDTPLEVIYNVKKEEVEQAEVTEEVMQQFFEKHAILRSVKRTPIDNLVGHAALVFELVYPESKKIAQEQGYLKTILEYPSKNKKTIRKLETMRTFMENYLQSKA